MGALIVRLQPLVNCFDVGIEVAFVTKCLFTVGALVWLQPLMNCFDVFFQVAFFTKCLFTMGALVWLQPLMNSFDVGLEVAFLTKSLFDQTFFRVKDLSDQKKKHFITDQGWPL